MKVLRSKRVLVALLAVFVLAGAALFLKLRSDRRSPEATLASPFGAAMSSRDPLGVYVLTSGAKVGQPFEIRAHFYAWSGGGDLEAFIILPQSAVYLDGEQLYRGPIKAGEEKVLTMKAAFLESGRWAIGARGRVFLGDNFNGPLLSGSYAAYLEISAADARVLPLTQVAAYRTELPGTTLGMEGPRSEFELLNKGDQQLFLVINDRAGVEDWKRRALVPARAWGEWGPNFPFEGYSPLHADFNSYFVVAVYDRQRPTTGYRAFIEGIAPGPTALNVYVRFAAPPPGLAVAQKPTSPYEVRYFGRDWTRYQVDKPVEVNFIMDGKVLRRQSVVLVRPGQGAIEFALPFEELKTIAAQKISRRKGIPMGQLRFDGTGRSASTEILGFVTTEYHFMDTKAVLGHGIYLDPFGREVDVQAVGRAAGRAKYALYYGGIEPRLKDLLDKKGPEDQIPVEIWWRANRPGPTYKEVNQPVVDVLRRQNINAHLDDRLPFGRATVPKKKVADVLALEGIAFMGVQEGK